MKGWINKILEYKFEFEYLLDKDNVLANALSYIYEFSDIVIWILDIDPQITSLNTEETLLLAAEKCGKIIFNKKKLNN